MCDYVNELENHFLNQFTETNCTEAPVHGKELDFPSLVYRIFPPVLMTARWKFYFRSHIDGLDIWDLDINSLFYKANIVQRKSIWQTQFYTSSLQSYCLPKGSLHNHLVLAYGVPGSASCTNSALCCCHPFKFLWQAVCTGVLFYSCGGDGNVNVVGRRTTFTFFFSLMA